MQERTNPREGARDEAAIGLPQLNDLITLHASGCGWVVEMPLITLGGNAVRVTVLPVGEGFTVSDDDVAMMEAKAAGICATSFLPAASAKAAIYGALLDEGVLLFPTVHPEQLRGAVVALANMVKEILDKLADSSKEAAA